jgi:hypothetical protein
VAVQETGVIFMTREYLKSQNEDPFYSETNQSWIASSINQFNDGTPLITMTFEELEFMFSD